MSDEASAPPGAPDAPAPASPAGARRGRVLTLVAGLVLLGGLGAGGWLLAPRVLGRAPTPAEARPAPVVVKATVPVGPVVVNLAGDTRRYARVGLSLGVPGVKDTKAVEEARAQLLDLVIGVLSSRSAEDLTSETGREEVKVELLERARTELALDKVARVYFTEFVIQ